MNRLRKPQVTLKKMVIHTWRIGILVAVCSLAGCGTPFKYNPKYGQTYPVVPNTRGVEIAGGTDQRPEDAKLPEWSRSVEVIVARAVADELQHGAHFSPVKIHLQGPARLDKYSYFIEFRVEEFEMVPRIGPLEQIGRTALDALGWWRGSLISASIPKTWESRVKVEFEAFDAATRQSIFKLDYADSRRLKANGYQGKSQQIQQTSDCLEAVVQQFANDFSHMAASRGSPSNQDRLKGPPFHQR